MAGPLLRRYRIRCLVGDRRRALGLTQMDVYKSLGRERTWFYKVEHGLVSPTVDELITLAQILEVQPWWHLIELVPEPQASLVERQQIQDLQTGCSLRPYAQEVATVREHTRTRALRREAPLLLDASTP